MKEAKRVALGTLTALGVYLLLLALGALLAVDGRAPESAFPALSSVFACLSAFAGAAMASFGTQDRREVLAFGCACTFWAAVVLLGLLCFGEAEPERLGALALPAACGGGAACFLRRGKSAGNRKRGKRRLPKVRRST